MSGFDKLVAHSKKVSHFNHLSAICGWDQAAVMPSGGAEARAAAMAQLHVHIHQLMTQPDIAEWIDQANQEPLSIEQQAIVREFKRHYDNANILPTQLVEAKSLAGARCEHAWRSQRKHNDWAGFEKNWAEVVTLSQEEAQIRASASNTTPYDAMLALYEPGVTTEQLSKVFSDVKQWLPDLVDQAVEKQRHESIILPEGQYPTSAQKALGEQVMALLQFDFNHGRLDESVHPFCGGVPTDVRITTRYDESEFIQSLMGIVHETGHARYEQGLPQHLTGLAAGEARSMGIHESQSLFFEMQLGRSPEFIDHLAQLARQHFSTSANSEKLLTTENVQRLYTRVNKGFIRIDADELTYPAHVILRYEIERDLMNGQIRHSDVPELWNEKMQASLGLSTAGNYRDGCMQDIHWTDGSFGYFPSYTLGAMYAAQFKAAMRKTIDIETVIRSGELSPIFSWLRDNIWSKGSTLSTNDLVKQATGETLNPRYFKDHLTDRYL